MKDDPCVRRVVFTDAACEGLGRRVGEMARKSKSKFYDDTESFKAAVSEVRLVWRDGTKEGMRLRGYHGFPVIRLLSRYHSRIN